MSGRGGVFKSNLLETLGAGGAVVQTRGVFFFFLSWRRVRGAMLPSGGRVWKDKLSGPFAFKCFGRKGGNSSFLPQFFASRPLPISPPPTSQVNPRKGCQVWNMGHLKKTKTFRDPLEGNCKMLGHLSKLSLNLLHLYAAFLNCPTLEHHGAPEGGEGGVRFLGGLAPKCRDSSSI